MISAGVITTKVLLEVGKRTAALAAANNNDKFATSDDDLALLMQFLDDGVLKVATACGFITPTTDLDTTKYDDIIPVQQYLTLIYWVLGEWFTSIGVPNNFRDKYEQELRAYRFSPNTPATAERIYRPF